MTVLKNFVYYSISNNKLLSLLLLSVSISQSKSEIFKCTIQPTVATNKEDAMSHYVGLLVYTLAAEKADLSCFSSFNHKPWAPGRRVSFTQTRGDS